MVISSQGHNGLHCAGRKQQCERLRSHISPRRVQTTNTCFPPVCEKLFLFRPIQGWCNQAFLTQTWASVCFFLTLHYISKNLSSYNFLLFFSTAVVCFSLTPLMMILLDQSLGVTKLHAVEPKTSLIPVRFGNNRPAFATNRLDYPVLHSSFIKNIKSCTVGGLVNF